MDPLEFTDELSKYLKALFKEKLLDSKKSDTAAPIDHSTLLIPPITLSLDILADCEHIAGCLVDAYKTRCGSLAISIMVFSNVIEQTYYLGMPSGMLTGLPFGKPVLAKTEKKRSCRLTLRLQKKSVHDL